jgi:serine/threonine protein phosphatase PrpC
MLFSFLTTGARRSRLASCILPFFMLAMIEAWTVSPNGLQLHCNTRKNAFVPHHPWALLSPGSSKWRNVDSLRTTADDQDEPVAKSERGKTPPMPVVTRRSTFLFSVASVCGKRYSMEDAFCTAHDFCAVFDGHSGDDVSNVLRVSLYDRVQEALPAVMAEMAVAQKDILRVPTVEDYESALRRALEMVDREVERSSYLRKQGSTVVAAWVHETKPDDSPSSKDVSGTDGIDANKTCPPPPRRTLIVANIGDSRAVLSRNELAFVLTRDHRPNDPIERKRIEAAGGNVKWDGLEDKKGNPIPGQGAYRVNQGLSLARAIGDWSERPLITSEPDISVFPLQDETDDFIVLATDGLWDVMSSSDVVSFIHALIDSEEGDSIAAMLAKEALRRGSSDNITVIIVWLHAAHNSSIAGVSLS